MKKIALFSLMCCLCGVYAVPAFAGSCKERTIKSPSVFIIDGELPDSDDYLYVSAEKRNTHVGFACETGGVSENCDHGTLIAVKGVHYLGDVQQLDNGGLWRCHTEGWGPHKDDRWEAFGATALENCNESQLSTYKFFKTINDDVDIYCKDPKGVGSGTNQWCIDDMCRHRPCKDCGNNPEPPAQKTCKDLYGNNQNAVACCEAKDATWNDKDNRCDCVDKSKEWNGKQCVTKTKPVDPVKPGFCDKYKKFAKRYACCLAGKSTKWEGKDLSDDGTCVCTDTNKEWKYDETTKKGQCVVKETPVVEGECEYYFTGSIECANGNQYFERKVVKLPKSKINKECGTDILKTDVAQVMELMKKLCEEKQPDIYVVPPKTGPSDREIEQAQSVLSAFTASAKDEASVWRTAEGNFNGTRLASDITAGVVLGTVGGVVTGNIIKKNQVKKGFEALHCTVGGQKVADWGDEFSVGLQR